MYLSLATQYVAKDGLKLLILLTLSLDNKYMTPGPRLFSSFSYKAMNLHHRNLILMVSSNPISGPTSKYQFMNLRIKFPMLELLGCLFATNSASVQDLYLALRVCSVIWNLVLVSHSGHIGGS